MSRISLVVVALAVTDTSCAQTQPSGPPFPNHEVGVSRVAGPPLFYPTDLLVERKEGNATIECNIAVTGVPDRCAVIATEGGSEFATAALDYIAHSQFEPATQNGVVTEARARWIVPFTLLNGSSATDSHVLPPRQVAGDPPAYPEVLRKASREGVADLTCRVAIDGFTKDCLLGNASGGRLFGEYALEYTSHMRVAPAMRDGVAVEVRQGWTIQYKLLVDEDGTVEAADDATVHLPTSGLTAAPAVWIAGDLRANSSVRHCKLLHGSGVFALDRASLDEVCIQEHSATRADVAEAETGHLWITRWAVIVPEPLLATPIP